MRSRHDERIRAMTNAFARAGRAWALAVLWLPVAACGGHVSIGTASAALDAGGSSNSCPPATCSFVGAWQNSGFTGQKCGAAETIRFDDNGRWSRLVHPIDVDSGEFGDVWVDSGEYTVCGDRATGPELSSTLASFAAPWGCGPASDVTIEWMDNIIDAGSACIIHVTPTCSPGSGAESDPPVFAFFPCTP
jgi:hypothetical protein